MPNEPPIDIQFQPSGYLFLASPQSAATLEATVQLQRWGTHTGPSRGGQVLGGEGHPDPPPHAGHPQGRRGTGDPAVPHPAEGKIPLDKHGGCGCGILWYVGGWGRATPFLILIPMLLMHSGFIYGKGGPAPPKCMYWGLTL